jgi:glycosyltransferase involved in cell wall biosynthesis
MHVYNAGNTCTKELNSKQIYIGWIPFQRRALSLQKRFEFDVNFISFSLRHRLLRPMEYVVKSLHTLAILFRDKPATVWLQLPPSFLLHITFVYKFFFNRSLVVIVDCHNASFRKPWITIPGTVALLNRSDMVIVHNREVVQQALRHGVKQNTVHVLEDPPAIINAAAARKESTTQSIVVPCSFNRDEPIAELLMAARLVPDIQFIITGNFDRARGIHDLSNLPENVELTGFIPASDFDQLLVNASVILGLTNLEGIQLSVAGEALAVGKPMVLSSTKILRELFGDAAVFVNPACAESIANGCRDALTNAVVLQQEVVRLRGMRAALWLKQAERIAESLIGSSYIAQPVAPKSA